MAPLTHPAKKIDQVQQDQGHGLVLHVQEEVYRSTITFRRRVKDDPSSQKNLPGGQQEQGHGVVIKVQEDGYQSILNSRRRVTKYHRVSVRCSKFRNNAVSPVWIDFDLIVLHIPVLS